MTEYTYVGIDPGVNGGIACLCPNDQIKFKSFDSLTKQGIWLWIALEHQEQIKLRVVVEKVGGYMGANRGGGKETRGSHMFAFGESFGLIQGCLLGCGLQEKKDYWFVHPKTWQARVGIEKSPKGETYAAHKRRLKTRAEVLFPQLRMTLETADALLLAHYCKETYS